jgi:hypothetical protein
MRIFIAFIMACVAAIAPAQAADVFGGSKDTPARVMPSETLQRSWTSLWVAALAGYSMTNTNLGLDYLDGDEDEDARWRNLGRVDGFGGEGFDASLQVGGDIEVRGIVAGVMGEYTFGGAESTVSIFDGVANLDVEQKDGYCLMGRLGVARGDTLFYGASGWCHTEFDATLSLGDESAKQTFEFDGIPLEGGVEHRFTQNIRGRLAARYTFWDEETILGGEDAGARLTAEPGQFSIKAGLVISTGGVFDPLN